VKFRHPLSPELSAQALLLEEFANGGAQCHARLRDGTVHGGILISNATSIIAMRGQEHLPFAVDAIADLFQCEDDRSPRQRDGWQFFDSWPGAKVGRQMPQRFMLRFTTSHRPLCPNPALNRTGRYVASHSRASARPAG
jgi:hypothetical protein